RRGRAFHGREPVADPGISRRLRVRVTMAMTDIRYIDGLRQAIESEMERDASIIVLGEDVAVGGPFGVTAGLVERFGEQRVINTPISEDSIMGVATGAALAGKRPIIEIMFID